MDNTAGLAQWPSVLDTVFPNDLRFSILCREGSKVVGENMECELESVYLTHADVIVKNGAPVLIATYYEMDMSQFSFIGNNLSASSVFLQFIYLNL